MTRMWRETYYQLLFSFGLTALMSVAVGATPKLTPINLANEISLKPSTFLVGTCSEPENKRSISSSSARGHPETQCGFENQRN
ncbi:MAG: hypothetical protein V4736_01730 [Bdellovibrionota bacterium]